MADCRWKAVEVHAPSVNSMFDMQYTDRSIFSDVNAWYTRNRSSPVAEQSTPSNQRSQVHESCPRSLQKSGHNSRIDLGGRNCAIPCKIDNCRETFTRNAPSGSFGDTAAEVHRAWHSTEFHPIARCHWINTPDRYKCLSCVAGSVRTAGPLRASTILESERHCQAPDAWSIKKCAAQIVARSVKTCAMKVTIGAYFGVVSLSGEGLPLLRQKIPGYTFLC